MLPYLHTIHKKEVTFMEKRKVSIYDVAKASGLSPATISRVLNHPEQVKYQTKQKVLETINFIGFNEKTNFAEKNDPIKKKLGPKSFILCIPFNNVNIKTEIIDGALCAAEHYKHNLLMFSIKTKTFNLEDFIFMIKANSISGILLLATLPDVHLKRLKENIPIVQCSEYSEFVNGISYVGIDETLSMYNATLYATSTGISNIIYLTSDLGENTSKRMYSGFSKAMTESGLIINPDSVIEIKNCNYHSIYKSVVELLSTLNKPLVFITVSDIFSNAILFAAQKLGLKIPDDLIVISFGSSDSSILFNDDISTTIIQPSFNVGYNAFELLLQESTSTLIDKKQIIYPTNLVINNYTD